MKRRKAKQANRLTRNESRPDAVKARHKVNKTPFEILKARLEEAIALKREGKYHDRDFDRLVDSL